VTSEIVLAARARRRWSAVLVLAFATALPAEAQRAREEEQLAAERKTLERRGREVQHTGEPLQLVGVGAGDPDVLARTPALASATLGLARVDREELYARKLALYDGTARFDRAPRTLGPAVTGARRDETRRAPSRAALDSSEASDSAAIAWPWVAGALAALVYILRRAVVSRGRAPDAARKR